MRSNNEDSDDIGVSYTMSPIYIENNMNIDNLILSRWNTSMKNGYFRFLNKLSTVLAEGNIGCVGTTLILSRRKYCQENIGFLYNFSQIDQLIGMNEEILFWN